MVASIVSLVSGKIVLFSFLSTQHYRQAKTFSSFFNVSYACFWRDLKSRFGQISNVNVAVKSQLLFIMSKQKYKVLICLFRI